VVSPLGRGFSGLYNLDFAGAQKDFATWQELRMTSARILLSIAYVGEKDKPRALQLPTGLQREFPTNTVFPRQIAHLRTAH
jgi:hypothetical protein